MATHRVSIATRWARGFQPGSIEIAGRSGDEVVDRAAVMMAPSRRSTWWSSETETYAGPPAVWASWA